MKQVPMLLIWLRLFLGLCMVPVAVFFPGHFAAIAIPMLTVGLISDILDGIVARRLGVSTEWLRRMDSSVDQVFFVAVVCATWIHCPTFFSEHALKLGILVGFEVMTYVLSFAKFRKEVATHTLGAKAWTLLLFATLVQLMIQCESGMLFEVFFWVGLLTRMEIMAIILILKEWTNDVPTVYHAVRLRQWREIRRSNWFSG